MARTARSTVTRCMAQAATHMLQPAVLLGILATAAIAWGQPVPSKEPSSTHIFPAGAQRGTTVQVRVGAECYAPGTRLHMEGQGLTATPLLEERLPFLGEPDLRRKPTEIPITYPKEWAAEVTIAADAEDTAFWWLSSAQGGSASRPFLIGDLPEHVEQESNSSPALAEQVELPITINGQIYGERDTDYFQLPLAAGQLLVVETICRRIGSRLDPLLEIRGPDGRRLAPQQIYRGDDPVLAITASVAGNYVLRVANVSFHGDAAHVYRLNLTTTPLLKQVFPAGALAGSEATFELLTFPRSPEPLIRNVQVPADAKSIYWHYDEALDGNFPIVVERAPGHTEHEPNDALGAAQPIAIDTIVSGRMHRVGDIDGYRLAVRQGVRYEIQCRPRPAGSATLPVLHVCDANGTVLATCRSIERDDRTCRHEWIAANDGQLLLQVTDLHRSASVEDSGFYELTVREAAADFQLLLASDHVNITQGAGGELSVEVRRKGGFDGEIQLEFQGLPPEIIPASAVVPAGQTVAKIALQAAANVPAKDYSLQVVGRATIAGQSHQRIAQCAHLGVDGTGLSIGPAWRDHCHLTVKHRPVFRLECTEAYEYAHRGSIYHYRMQVERLNGFNGPITLQLGDRQNRDLDGIDYLEVTIPPDQTQIMLPIHLPETMHINVQSQSQVYCQGYASFQDEFGEMQSVLVVSEKRNMIRTLPPVAKLVALDPSLPLTPGSELLCRVQLERTSNFTAPATIELIQPVDSSLVAAAPVTLPAGEETATVKVRFAPNASLAEVQRLRFRATGSMERGSILVTEAEVALEGP